MIVLLINFICLVVFLFYKNKKYKTKFLEYIKEINKYKHYKIKSTYANFISYKFILLFFKTELNDSELTDEYYDVFIISLLLSLVFTCWILFFSFLFPFYVLGKLLYYVFSKELENGNDN